MALNFEYYKIFYEVAIHSNITLAAKNLLLTQPAVSKSIHNLEQELGCALFSRSKKGVKLTEEGKVLFDYVSKAYKNILIGEKRVKNLINLEQGLIRIGASEITLHFYLLPFLEKFHKVYPNIKMHLYNSSTPNTIEALKKGEIDFGLVTSPIRNCSSLEFHEVCEIQDIFIAGNQFESLKNKTLALNELLRYPIISLDENTNTQKYLNDFFLSNGISLEPEFELATMDLVVPFVKRNLGIGIVVKNFAERAIEEGLIFEIKTTPAIPKRNICIVTDPKNPFSLAGHRFFNEFF